MKACGVIVEYNPFHNGHAYHLQQARNHTKADILVGVMSGNFLQRGEPAVIDKWQRTKEALQQGVDLVIELPVVYAVQPADIFAKGSVQILQAVGCSSLCFGTDVERTFDYAAYARFTAQHEEEIQQEFHKVKNNGESYPQQMTKVWQKLYPAEFIDNYSPNHILGLAYAKQNHTYPTPMEIVPILRQHNGYHDQEVSHPSVASATSIRHLLFKESNHKKVSGLVPHTMADVLLKEKLTNWESFWPFLRYQLLIKTPEELKKIYQMVEGIEYRLKEIVKFSTTFEQFIQQVKTKRFTQTRLQRLLIYVLLSLTKSEVEQAYNTPYIRVLGFTNKGKTLIHKVKRKTQVPIITNINKKNSQLLTTDLRAGKVYQLGTENDNEQDYFQQPIRL